MDDRHKKAIVGMSSMPVPEDQRTLLDLLLRSPPYTEGASIYNVRKMFTTPTGVYVTNQLILHPPTTPFTLQMF